MQHALPTKRETMNSFTVGNHFTNDVFVKDFSLLADHCKFVYDGQNGWVLQDRNYKHNVYGSQVYLCNYQQYVERKPSYCQFLVKDMLLKLESEESENTGVEFEVDMKNYDPDAFEEELYGESYGANIKDEKLV